MKFFKVLLCCAIAGTAACAATGETPQPGSSFTDAAPAASCEGLQNLHLRNTRITLTELVQPGWEMPRGPMTRPSADLRVPVPFCRVVLTIEQEINVEVWLPPIWNGRQLGVGNAGLTGAIFHGSLLQGVQNGFAVSSTDTGHVTPNNAFQTDWVDGHPDRIENFGHRAHHLTAEAARAIITAYYGRPPHHAYFQGCSAGGWQAMTEAQRYPQDYDGIVAGAPAFNVVQLQALGIQGRQYTQFHPDSVLSWADGQLLVRAAVAACDANDGVTDGLIENPRRCAFDPASLQCSGAKTPQCLSASQVARVRAIYGERIMASGFRLYPGASWGSSPGTDLGGRGVQQGEHSMVELALAQPPAWTVATFEAERDIPFMEREVGGILSSYNPDLSAFRARGGRLIMYHGWADPLLMPENTLHYYEQMGAALGDVRDFIRLFMAPGMDHCFGGYGPDQFDALSALIAWVETDTAPDQLIAAQRDGGGAVTRTRPLCPWPQQAVYNGSGSTDEAQNFRCAVAD